MQHAVRVAMTPDHLAGGIATTAFGLGFVPSSVIDILVEVIARRRDYGSLPTP